MTTRAEEIAGDGPYTAYQSAVDLTCWLVVERGTIGPVYEYSTPIHAGNAADALNAAHANGYKQGQQDRWVPVEKRTPDLPIEAAGSRFSERVLVYRSLAPKHMQVGEATYADFGPMDKGWMGESGNGITHWMPLPEKPEQR